MNPYEGELQGRIGAWHRRRFPDAKATNVTLKGTEEMGEVAFEVNGLEGFSSATGGTGDTKLIAEEAADVVICMMVLVDRWCNTDLLDEVEKKLLKLEDPNGTHRASLGKMDNE